MSCQEHKKKSLYHKNWRKRNIEKCRKYELEYAMKKYWKNPKLACAKNWSRRQKKIIELKKEMINAFGGACECCKESHIEFLSIEHKNGGGRLHRKQLHNSYNIWKEAKSEGWPKEKYTVLCINCNWATRPNKLCPHKQNALPY